MKRITTSLLLLALTSASWAASETVTLHQVTGEGIGDAAGSVKIEETPYGLQFTPDLKGQPPGIHGFHVHAIGSCEPAMKDGKAVAAGAAGGHFDPDNTGKHLGPWAEGHLGDLPALYVTEEGLANYPVLAPRLKQLSTIKGKALMVHVGGDNHADHPKPLGGGGDRWLCGVIKP